MKRARILRLIGAVAIVGVAASACGTSSPGDASSYAYTGPVPSFEGPYAAEFEEYYRSTESDFARRVLADGQITDAEYAEMEERFRSCLAEDGITFGGFRPDGGYTTSLAPNGGDTYAMIQVCSKSSGEDTVGALYSIMRTNPENLDGATIMAECLVKKGVVPPGYDANAYSQHMEGLSDGPSSLPPDLYDALMSCSDDPLGLFNDQ